MRRRVLLASMSVAALSPSGLRAQQPHRRIGLLLSWSEADPEARAWIDVFLNRLRELGWTDGRNIRIDYRWTAGDANLMRSYAAELAASAPDAIVANTTTVLLALRRATTQVPVVFLQVSDPVGGGLVASLARPGGNITGFTGFEYSFGGKWLEILKEIAPATNRALVLGNSRSPSWEGYRKSCEAAAQSLRIELVPAGVGSTGEIEQAVDAFSGKADGALVVLPDNITLNNRDVLVARAARHRLPAIYPLRNFPVSGGLMSFGPETSVSYKGAAAYVDRILKGEKPADLPVQATTTFQLVVNLKTSRALGLTMPLSILARAHEVIE